MTAVSRQRPATGATFLYDGDCSFCAACARFLVRWIPTPAGVLPWQRVDLAAAGLTPAACEQAVQWVRPGRSPLAGPDAIVALLRSSGGPWWRLAGRVLGLAPVRAASGPVYRLVARNRHRLPGGTAACAPPPAPPAVPAPPVRPPHSGS
jgi:predicted DCC family thiol-disulfide oxidoreductase YuxK